MAKLITAIQNIDIPKEEATTYHLRFSEQLGMDQVKSITNGNDRTNRIHLRTNFTQPSLPSSRAILGSGGVALIAGKNGISTNTASSTVLEALLPAPVDFVLVLLPSSLIPGSLWLVWACSEAGSM